MILKIVSTKNLAKQLAFFVQTTASFLQKFDHDIGFQEKRHFIAENWGKSQKTVIITSTPNLLYLNLFILANTCSTK
jgi:hypothetical protein